MTRQKAIRFGVQTPPQNTTWDDLHRTWKLIDAEGYDTAWVFDHFFPIMADPGGTCLEGWTLLPALAALTERVELGVLVTGNTYRHPAVLAKMGSTLDHISNGRLIMGLGAAWFELEHSAYGIPFHTTGQRIDRLDEAAELIKRLWTERLVDFDGRFYRLVQAYCEPKPVRKPHPPLMIGGGGEKKTLRVTARHANQWNTVGSPELFRRKIAVLRDHCQAVGRDFEEIELSWAGLAAVAGSKSGKDELIRSFARTWKMTPEELEPAALVGTESEVRDKIAVYIEEGVTHFILMCAAPVDHGALRVFAERILPAYR